MTRPELTAAIILFVLSGGLTILANMFLAKARKIAKEAKIKCESAKEEIEKLEERNKNQYSIIQHLKAYSPFSDLGPRRYRIEKTNFSYDIYADYRVMDGKSTTKIRIKRFPFCGDPEFAKLEAQELIDHLNEK